MTNIFCTTGHCAVRHNCKTAKDERANKRFIQLNAHTQHNHCTDYKPIDKTLNWAERENRAKK